MRRFFLFSALSLALVALGGAAGCAGATEDDTSSSEDELRALTIGEGDDGKTFNVEKGQSFKVALGSNPTTGYKWMVASTTKTLGYPTPKAGEFVGPGDDAPASATGSQVFTWRTTDAALKVASTKHSVTLEYRRPFDSPTAAPAKTFKFKVVIKKKGAAPPSPPPAAEEPIELYSSEDGAIVDAKQGQDLVIRLAENASTGYRWYVVSEGDLDDPTSETDASSTAVGASGARVFTWKTDGKVGTHEISLKSSRGASGTAAEAFSMTLNVLASDADSDVTCPTRTSINCMP